MLRRRAARLLLGLLLEQLPEPLDLVVVLRLMRAQRVRHLAGARQLQRERDVLDRVDRADRLRHELGLAEVPALERGVDEHLRVAGALVAREALLEGLRAELGDRVARVDVLRAALVAEVAARALPDAVLAVQVLEPVDVAALADRPPAKKRPQLPQAPFLQP